MDANAVNKGLMYVRNALAQILQTSEFKDLKGVIACYTRFKEYDKNNQVSMSVLPLYEGNIFPSSGNISDRKVYGNRARGVYQNNIRPNEYSFHKDHFLHKFNNKDHFELTIADENVLLYGHQGVELGGECSSIDTYFNALEEESAKTYQQKDYRLINTIDQCYFSSGCKELLLIPIPLLSTPVFLLAIEYEEKYKIGDEKERLINEIYNLSKITVRHYIQTNLIDKLSHRLSTSSDNINNSRELIEIYTNELCEILLPKRWEIGLVLPENNWQDLDANSEIYDIKCESCENQCSEVARDESCQFVRYLYNNVNERRVVRIKPVKKGNYIDQWPSAYKHLEKEETYYFHFFISLNGGNAEVNNNQYIICIEQTSFKFPISKNFGKGNWTYEWVQNLPEYGIAASQMGSMLSSIFNLIYEQWKNLKDIRSQATQSAFAAIMSRNMSHNIGSHVLPGVAEVLSSENRELFKLMDKLGIPVEALRNKNIRLKQEEKPPEKKPLLKSFKKELEADESLMLINKHIQERMEFIADVTMAQIFMYSTFPFQAVVDDFTSKKDYLKYLSGNAKIEIEFKVAVEGVEKSEVFADFPNDLMGVHAFFIILENIIRNTVKHSNLFKPDGIEYEENHAKISIQVREVSSDLGYYCIDIFDNLGAVNRDKRAADDNALLYKIQEDMDADIIDSETNKIRSGSWGLLEMRFAAAFLVNQIKDNRYVSNKGNSLVEVSYYDDDGISGQGFNLGYRFLIKKPSLAKCFVEDVGLSEERMALLSYWGIEVVINEERVHKIEASEHQFIVIADNDSKVYINQRVIRVESIDDFIKVLVSGDKEKLECFLWKHWLEQNDIEFKNICIDSIAEVENCKNISLFDSHGHYLKSNLCNGFNIDSIAYYESYGSQSYTAKAIDKLNSNILRQYELQEAIHTHIAVIDERIQKAANEKDNNLHDYSKIELFKLMGIHIPLKEESGGGMFTLDLEDFIHHSDEYKDRLEAYLKQLLSDDYTRFIVIHMTIFEMLCSCKTKEGIEAKLAEFKESIQSNMEKSIILTSGRGTPSNLPSNCYFVHFSILQNYLVYNRSKFSLVKALYAVRKYR